MFMFDISHYTELGVKNIKANTILSPSDEKIIMNLSQELQRVFEVKQIWRTSIEAKYSILNDVRFPTPASKYWQCIKEQDLFWQQLVYLSLEYQKHQGELELLEIQLDEIIGNDKKASATRKIITSNINGIKFNLMQDRLHAHDRVREINMWEKLKNEQIAKADFDINDVEKHQLESYKERWIKELDLGRLCNKPDLFRHSKENLDTLTNDLK